MSMHCHWYWVHGPEPQECTYVHSFGDVLLVGYADVAMVGVYVCASSPIRLPLHGCPIWIITLGPNSGRLIDFTWGFIAAQYLLFLKYLWRSSVGHWKIQGRGNAANSPSVLGAKSNRSDDVVWILLMYPPIWVLLLSSLQGGGHKIKFQTYRYPRDIKATWHFAFLDFSFVLLGLERKKKVFPREDCIALGIGSTAGRTGFLLSPCLHSVPVRC